jgi:hypothetical protein
LSYKRLKESFSGSGLIRGGTTVVLRISYLKT